MPPNTQKHSYYMVIPESADPMVIYLRSFTVNGPPGTSNIGVVLYQRSFWVPKCDKQRVKDVMGRDAHAAGGMTVTWANDPAKA